MNSNGTPRRRRHDFVMLQRSVLMEIAGKMDVAALGTYLLLVAEADHKSGAIRDSVRGFASRVPTAARRTVANHIRRLQAGGLVEVVPATNQHTTGEIRVLRYEELTSSRASGGQVVGKWWADNRLADGPPPAETPPKTTRLQDYKKTSINLSVEDDGLSPDLKYLLDSLCSTSGTWQHSRKVVEELAAKEDPGPVMEALRRCREMEDAGNPIDKPVAYLRRILKNLTTGEDSSVRRPFVRPRGQPGRRSLEMARKLADADGGSENFKALFGLPVDHDEQVLEGEVEEEVQP